LIPRFPTYLFDIDGTLLDSAADICGAAVEILLAVPKARSVSDEFLRSFIGRHLFDLFYEVVPDCTPEVAEDLLQRYRGVYRARRHASTRVYPGVDQGLAMLGGLKATATTKSSETARLVLSQFGLLDYFDHVQGTDGFPSKPAPDVIHASLEALGTRPEDCMLVGDSAADMEAGKRAGVSTCAVRYGYGEAAELEKHTPDYWIDDLRELVG
jgi:HAD superfamily hydrolase (TIGR01509 family)